MAWIHDYPRWLIGLAILAIFTAGAVGGLLAPRRWVRRRGLHELIDNGVIGWIFSATLAIYAITIGLTAVSSALWSVVLLGAVLAIGGSYVFHTEHVGAHAIMAGLLAAMIGLLVFFIAVTDMPFRGSVGIAPTACENVLHDLVDGLGS